MSRSRKKHPITGFTTCKSEKQDKRIYNRIIRHKVNAILKNEDLDELEDFIEPDKNEIMNRWSMGKDGKTRYTLNEEFIFYKDLYDRELTDVEKARIKNDWERTHKRK